MHPNVHSNNGHNGQIMERAKVPFNRWMEKKKWSIYTMEYYSAIRKDEYPTFASTWMGLEEIMLSKISKAEKVNYMVSLTCRT